MFRIALFGVPHLSLETVDLSKAIRGRSLALLVYLAVTGKAQDRNILADLLWDNLTEAQAKKNLRYVLYDLRQAIGDYLLVSRQTIAFNRKGLYWLDVEVFSSYLHAEEPKANVELYQEVLDLYQGEFLNGFYIQDAPMFEEWLNARRRQLHTQIVHGFHLLAQEYLAQHQYEKGLQITQRLLTLEPWNEEAHRQQIRLLAYSGRRSAALAQYEACCRALTAEYSVEPLAETVQLYEEIKTGRFSKWLEPPYTLSPAANDRLVNHRSFNPVAAPSTQQPTTQAAPVAKSSVPATLATQVNWDAIPVQLRLFGHVEELTRLEQWISSAGCRLISLSGAGGQGKSALAAEVVRRLADHAEDPSMRGRLSTAANSFDSIFWCSLAGIASFAQLIAYWWRRCNVLAGLTDPEWLLQEISLEEQLAYLFLHLRQQRCLVVLDQLEQILQPGRFTGVYHQGWEQFPELVRRIAESEHQSCLLLISREELPEFTYLTRNTSAVRTLSLQGLAIADSVAMLRSHGFTGEESLLATLAQHYAGLPFALTCLGAMYRRLPSDQLSTLLVCDPPLFDELHNLLAQQCKRLSVLEQELLFWLALEQTAVSFEHFWQTFISTDAKGHMLDAYQSLVRRSLVQVELTDGSISLPSLVLRYITQYLIDAIVTELVMAWYLIAQAPPALPTPRLAHPVPMKYTIAARYRAGSTLEVCAPPVLLYTDSQEQQGTFQVFPQLEQVTLPVVEKEVPFARSPLPFSLLQHYRLVNPNATGLVRELQNNHILFPVVKALYQQWGVRVTRIRLQELLAYLLQHFEIEMPIAEYNLQRLVTSLDFN